MVDLNVNKTPLGVLLESVANHTSGSLHITATDSDWSNIEGDRLTFHHGNTGSVGCGADQPPQTPVPWVESPTGSVPLIDLRHCRFMNIKGSDKTFHFQDNVSPEMQRFFENLAAIKPRVQHVSSTEPREDFSPTEDEELLGSDFDETSSESPSNSLNEPSAASDFIVINPMSDVKRR